MKQAIQAAVEQQLLVAGNFSPLEWLIESGAVHYPDYVAWRNSGRGDYLMASARRSESDLLSDLKHAAWYAGELGLVPEPVVFNGWQSDNAKDELLIGSHRELSALIQQCWRRPDQEVQQFDLFMDNPALVLENDLLGALVLRHWPEAQKKLDQIYQCDPGNLKLGDYESLIAYGVHCDSLIVREVGETDECVPSLLEEELLGLEGEVVPLAARVLENASRDYLAPAWGRLGQGLEGLAFLPGRPKMHASYAWLKYQDWQRVENSVLGETGYLSQPELVWRLALACFYQQSRGYGLGLLCLLVGLDEGFALRRFEACPDSGFLRAWRCFQALDVELPMAEFPGWLLLQEPGVVHQLEDYPLPSVGRIYEAVFSLLMARAKGDNAHELACRKQLQACSPALLKVYLQKV